MHEGGLRRHQIAAHVQADAGIALISVPVAPVALELAQRQRNLIGRRLDFLQADDIRALALDPLVELPFARPESVYVPGRNLQFGASAGLEASVRGLSFGC